MRKHTKAAQLKLEEIADAILNHDYAELNDIGLLGGVSGVMLFLFHYGQYTQEEKYFDKGVELLYKSMDIINEGKAVSNFSYGISGFGWVLEYLAEKGFIDKIDVLHNLDESLCELMSSYTKNDNWDALHGGIGIAWYLFYRLENVKVRQAMEAMVEILATLAIKDKNGIKWRSHNPLTGESSFNFGLAHGMPSILIFLKKCIDNHINVELATQLLKDNLQFILSQKLSSPQYNRYPLSIKTGQPKEGPRMAWCYGDIGMLLAFTQVNQILGTLDVEIKTIAKSCIPRRNLRQTNINDAGVCHGTASVLHPFQVLQDSPLLKTIITDEDIDYWLLQTLQIGNKTDGIAGYLHLTVKEDIKSWVKEIGLLGGVAGIGLSLLSYINDDKSWSKCLMMSQ